MTAPAVTNTFVTGTTAYAGQVNTNFSDLVTYLTNLDNGSSTWGRVLATSTSAVPLIANNSSGTSNIANFQDNGVNVFQILDGGDVYMKATAKLYLDGGGNTYLVESGADVIDFYAGGANYFKISHAGTLVSVIGAHLAVPAGKTLYLDGGSNTYLSETAADIIDFYAGATVYLRVDHNTTMVAILNGDLRLSTTKKLLLSAGTADTYIHESSADTIDLVAGAGISLRVTDTLVSVLTADLAIPATSKVYLDGGTNTYIAESAGDNMVFYTGGTLALQIDSSQVLDYRLAAVALGGGAAPTVGTIGGSGPASAGQNSWVKVKIAGVDSFIPIWR